VLSLYIIGYLIIALIVAKVYKKWVLTTDNYDKYKTDDEAILYGVTWATSIPLVIIFFISGGIIMLLVEGGKKLL
jgi:hypothetical protein